jgi:DNA-binding XRE family transcriptional regulator
MKTNKPSVTQHINALQGRYSVSNEELALAIGVNQSTLRRKLKEPGKFTLTELTAIADYLHTSVADIVGKAAA